MADSNPLDMAVMPPPPGETQNLDNPPNHNDAVIAVYTVCIVVATIFVALRLYARFIFLRNPRVVDYLLVPTFGVFIAHCVFWLKMNGTTGNFVHMWNFRVKGLAPFYRNGFYGTIFYETVMMTIKPLILLEWTHIFASNGTRPIFRWICYTVATINVLMYAIAILIDAASCKPRERWWDTTIKGHCVNTRDLPIVTGTMNAVIDLIILLLPQRIIWRLHVSKNKRIGVSLVFCIGVVSVAAAIARTALAYVYADSMDVTWNFSKAGIFILLEMTAAILVFAVPTAPKPSVHLAKRAGSSLVSLIRPNRSGSGSSDHGPYATGMSNPRGPAYDDLEGGQITPLAKARSARSKTSADADSEMGLAYHPSR